MNIDFKNDIHVWLEDQDKRTALSLNTIDIPSSQELFFEAKLTEIHRQYQAARIFLCQVDNADWDYWYEPFNHEMKDGISKVSFNGMFLETAILYYNIVVDLTWILCYVSAEFAGYKKGKVIQLDGINLIQDTKDMIRDMEKLVSNPSTEENPLNYLKAHCPEYAPAIDLVYDFWKGFADSEVRKLYNFIKHKGKPQYNELYQFTAKKFYSFHKGDQEYPTDSNDVKLEISLYKTVELLKDYDNEILFPYCDKLIELLVPLVYKQF
ncbi:MAG: hypothetical protein GX285_07620 [Clostridiales bacterium]|nr:hypothetical protein [Clostridiales bacterium]